MKLSPFWLRRKYSLATLRPPITAIAPSAMNSLLCMRWLTRFQSPTEATKRIACPESRMQQNGLKMRTSTFLCAAKAMNISSLPWCV